jgi:hypothetical protein
MAAVAGRIRQRRRHVARYPRGSCKRRRHVAPRVSEPFRTATGPDRLAGRRRHRVVHLCEFQRATCTPPKAPRAPKSSQYNLAPGRKRLGNVDLFASTVTERHRCRFGTTGAWLNSGHESPVASSCSGPEAFSTSSVTRSRCLVAQRFRHGSVVLATCSRHAPRRRTRERLAAPTSTRPGLRQ